MKRIGILTAGGDTPALNSTIFGAVTRANQLKVEVVGLISGFDSLYSPRVPHVLLNPLFRTIPELDAAIVLYCGGGYRSALAAEALQRMGYRNVVSMDGGFSGWKEAGYPVSTGD